MERRKLLHRFLIGGLVSLFQQPSAPTNLKAQSLPAFETCPGFGQHLQIPIIVGQVVGVSVNPFTNQYPKGIALTTMDEHICSVCGVKYVVNVRKPYG